MARRVLEGFRLTLNEENDEWFAYRPQTGETMLCNQSGEVLASSRELESWWRKSYLKDEEEKFSIFPDVPVFTYSESIANWGKHRPLLTMEEAHQAYSKLFDEDEQRYFFTNRVDGTASWCKPKGVPANMPEDEDWTCEGTAIEDLHTSPGNNWEEFDVQVAAEDNWEEYDETSPEAGMLEGYDMIASSGNKGENYEGVGNRGNTWEEYYETSAIHEENYEENGHVAEDTPGGFVDSVGDEGTPIETEKQYIDRESAATNYNELPKAIQDGDTHDSSERHDVNGHAITRFDDSLTKGDAFEPAFRTRVLPFPWPARKKSSSMSAVLPFAPSRYLAGVITSTAGFLDTGEILKGPYCRRFGVGRQIERSIHRLPPQSTIKDRVALGLARNEAIFLDASDISLSWLLGEPVNFFDGVTNKSSTLEAMMLTRAALEQGPLSVVSVMERYHERADVQCFGLINLTKIDYIETSTGAANSAGRAVLGITMRVLRAYLDKEEAVQGYALALLLTLAQNYAMRREIAKEEWVAATAAALIRAKTVERKITIDRGRGEKEIVYETKPTRHAVAVCTCTCQLFSSMAFDHANRQEVCEDGLSLVLQAMQLCPEEPLVQLNACRAIYNFVYRCEAAHILTAEEDALDAVEPLCQQFSSDDDLMLTAKRTIRALQPDGWRGSAD